MVVYEYEPPKLKTAQRKVKESTPLTLSLLAGLRSWSLLKKFDAVRFYVDK
jgi:hypothetical protein